jgi:myo-inositol-1(or 4)-monophosphatase
MKEIRILVEKAIVEAGEIFTNTVLKKEHIETKGPANFVTVVDYKVQEFLVHRLNEIIPGSNMITEESKENIFDLEKPTWIIDPVDGTTNLMYGYQHSAISIGLCMDGKLCMGFVYDPALKEMFFAESGKGAFLNGNRIRVSDNKKLMDSLIGFGTTPYDRGKADDTFRVVGKIYKSCRDVRRSGSAALDISYVACGRMDGFFEMTLQPWDFAAGTMILKEAGGIITKWNGEELNPVSASSVIASNGYIHNELSEYVRLI